MVIKVQKYLNLTLQIKAVDYNVIEFQWELNLDRGGRTLMRKSSWMQLQYGVGFHQILII